MDVSVSTIYYLVFISIKISSNDLFQFHNCAISRCSFENLPLKFDKIFFSISPKNEITFAKLGHDVKSIIILYDDTEVFERHHVALRINNRLH